MKDHGKPGQHVGAVGELPPSRPLSAVRRVPTGRKSAVLAPFTPDAGVALERIKQLSRRLARVTLNSGRHRHLTEAIRVEADAYRKSLDTEQVMARHDPH